MKNQEIIDRVTSVQGIDELNELQKKVLNSNNSQILIEAPTGSGKTIAFGIIILKSLSMDNGSVQALIVAPSRELVMQIGSEMRQIAKGYKTVELYGGHSFMDEKASLKSMPDILVATPGRLLDHLQRGTISFELAPSIIVLDEYDKVLQLGFEGEMKRIFKRVKDAKNFVLTSATKLNPLPDYLDIKAPETIIADKKNPGKLEVIRVESFSRDKLDSLSDLIKSIPADEKCMVFVNHRESAERVIKRLKHDDIAAGLYHGALDQQQRTIAIDLFANGTTPVIVATDLAARGLDIEKVSNVIHYHLPVNKDAWVHRNGRTARQDASGRVYVITSEADDIDDYMTFDRSFLPPVSGHSVYNASIGTIYFSAGKKEKISRGDIAGFILSNSDLAPSQVGKINVHDHFSLAAVPLEKTEELIAKLSAFKIKGKKVKITCIKP